MTELAKTQIASFAELVQNGYNCWIKAGEILVKLVDNGEVTRQEIAESSGLTLELLRWFEKIGRRTVHPGAMLSSSGAWPKVRSLGYQLQETLVKNPTVTLVTSPDGETVETAVSALTASQTAQVFGRDGMRSVEEQKQWLTRLTPRLPKARRLIKPLLVAPPRPTPTPAVPAGFAAPGKTMPRTKAGVAVAAQNALVSIRQLKAVAAGVLLSPKCDEQLGRIVDYLEKLVLAMKRGD